MRLLEALFGGKKGLLRAFFGPKIRLNIHSKRVAVVRPQFLLDGDLQSRVLIVVAVNAKEFPVAAILRIILVVMIFVMNRELSQPLTAKLSPTTRTNPGMDSQGLLPVTFQAVLMVLPGSGHNLIFLFPT